MRFLKTNTSLVIGGVVALSLSAALSAYVISAPLHNSHIDSREDLLFGAVGLVGVMAAAAVGWSAWMGSRGWVGLALGLAYLGISISPPLFIGAAHLYSPIAVLVIWCAGMNVLRGLVRQRVGIRGQG